LCSLQFFLFEIVDVLPVGAVTEEGMNFITHLVEVYVIEVCGLTIEGNVTSPPAGYFVECSNYCRIWGSTGGEEEIAHEGGGDFKDDAFEVVFLSGSSGLEGAADAEVELQHNALLLRPAVP
jgi:hypothetical protein